MKNLWSDFKKFLVQGDLVAVAVAFVIGAAFLYYFVFPAVFQFFISFESYNSAIPIELQARISEYLDLVVKLILGFGVAFQLPIILIEGRRANHA